MASMKQTTVPKRSRDSICLRSSEALTGALALSTLSRLNGCSTLFIPEIVMSCGPILPESLFAREHAVFRLFHARTETGDQEPNQDERQRK
jgi:hypothetical protein